MITTIRDRPDLLTVVAGWLWAEFLHWDHTLAETRGLITLPRPFESFVLLRDGRPPGTASLRPDDLSEQPDLTPWLAGVYVLPQARGRGVARALIAAVEGEAQAAGLNPLWLYTHTAESLYARLGWHMAETVPRPGEPTVTVMRRDLTAAS